MKKKMFFKMGVALLLSLAVLVGLAGCGAKRFDVASRRPAVCL